MVWNGVRDGRLELGDMEDQVHGLHALRELEHMGVGTWPCYDFKWTKVLLRQLL